MKLSLIIVLIFFTPFYYQNKAFAQEEDPKVKSYAIYVVTKNDGAKYVGKIIVNNSKEVIIVTDNLGEVAIPKHEIKNIEEVKDLNQVNYTDDISFNRGASRYLFSPNAIPLKKENNYIKLYYGVIGNAQFAITDRLSLGVITSYITVPVILSPKWSTKVSDNLYLGVGGLLGFGSWAAPSVYGGFGYGLATYGNEDNNVSLSVGYGAAGFGNSLATTGSPILSLGSCVRLGKRAWFIFDSYAFFADTTPVLFALPAVRWNNKSYSHWEFSFGGGIINDNVFPVPLVTWTRNFKE